MHLPCTFGSALSISAASLQTDKSKLRSFRGIITPLSQSAVHDERISSLVEREGCLFPAFALGSKAYDTCDSGTESRKGRDGCCGGKVYPKVRASELFAQRLIYQGTTYSHVSFNCQDDVHNNTRSIRMQLSIIPKPGISTSTLVEFQRGTFFPLLMLPSLSQTFERSKRKKSIIIQQQKFASLSISSQTL
jgi:hypothetical protein